MRFLGRITWGINRWHRQASRTCSWVVHWAMNSMIRFAHGLLRFPMYLVNGLVAVVRAVIQKWLAAARGRDLVLGLPFAIVVLGFFAISLMGLRSNLKQRTEIYDLAVRQAVARNDYDAAKLYLKRVLQGDVDRPRTRFLLGTLAIENGDTETANLLLTDLAPVDRPVYFEAHVWRAQQILGRGNISNSELVEAESQLINATSLRRNDSMANSLLGQLYRQTQRYAQARKHFLRINPRSPTDELFLAEVHKILNETSLARSAAQRAQQGFEARLKSRDRDIDSLLKLSATLRFLEQYQEADDLLRSKTLFADDPRLRRERVMNLIAWADSLREDDQNLGMRIELLRVALQVDPREPLVYDRLLQLLLSDSELSDQLRGSLQRQLAEGTAPALIHLMLGVDATTRQDVTTAVYHYRAALRIDPGLNVAANNLALSLLALDKPLVEEALAISAELCKQHPKVAAFQETRGQVLLQAKKYHESLEAFELALSELGHELPIHRGMAEAYKAIGMEELAQSHWDWIERNESGKQESRAE